MSLGMKIMIAVTDSLVENSSVLTLKIGDRELVRYFIDISRDLGLKELIVIGDTNEGLKTVAAQEGMEISFVEKYPADEKVFILDGSCLYSRKKLE